MVLCHCLDRDETLIQIYYRRLIDMDECKHERIMITRHGMEHGQDKRQSRVLLSDMVDPSVWIKPLNVPSSGCLCTIVVGMHRSFGPRRVLLYVS